jgi:hypothetical protein
MPVANTAGMGLSQGTKELAEMQNPEKLRQMSVSGEHPGIRQRLWGLEARLDPTVTFEEYEFWAKVEREMEDQEQRTYKELTKDRSWLGGFKTYFSNADDYKRTSVSEAAGHTLQSANAEKSGEPPSASDTDRELSPLPPPAGTHDMTAEWRTAARALRTTGWMTIFYLITTDILGWSQTPFVFSAAGYSIGTGVFILFGFAAAASGLMIWKVFMQLDSSRFPMLSFGDPFLRLFGPKTAAFINVMQAIQMWCSVAVVLIGNSQIFSQLVKAKVCYIAVVIIQLIIGIASGWLRSLKHLGWLCNFAVWFNIVSFIIIMAAAGSNGPDPTYAIQTTTLPKNFVPVKTFSSVPPAAYQQGGNTGFAAVFNGIDTIVYAYSGALLFIAFLAEMRHPMDFWKGMILAQTFIGIVYLLFGLVVYHYLGQYSVTSITQVISPYGLQLVCNILSLITGYLAIFLYFNIGMKVVYLEVGQRILKMPPITERKGYYLWLALGPVYWIIAFIFAVSVPNFTYITNLIGALFSLNFTYSIPAIMYAAWAIQNGAKQEGEGFDPVTGVTTRHDEGMKRWTRGLIKSWYYSIPAIIFALAGMASSGMGSWSAIESLKAVFGPGGTIQTSWGCAGPG